MQDLAATLEKITMFKIFKSLNNLKKIIEFNKIKVQLK